jgi:hypothetical protein
MAANKEATSTVHATWQSTIASPLWAPSCHKMTDKLAPLGATWHAHTSVMSSHNEHKGLHVGLSGWYKSAQSSTYDTIGQSHIIQSLTKSLVLRGCSLNKQPIKPCPLSTLMQINCQLSLQI